MQHSHNIFPMNTQSTHQFQLIDPTSTNIAGYVAKTFSNVCKINPYLHFIMEGYFPEFCIKETKTNNSMGDNPEYALYSVGRITKERIYIDKNMPCWQQQLELCEPHISSNLLY